MLQQPLKHFFVCERHRAKQIKSFYFESVRIREEIMEAMDQKLAILLSNQTHASTVRPPGPSMQPPEQHAAMQAGTPLMSIN